MNVGAFPARFTAPRSCARRSREPRQVRKEAAISDQPFVPRGSRGAVRRGVKAHFISLKSQSVTLTRDAVNDIINTLFREYKR